MDDKIKISELEPFPLQEDPLTGEDFLPMVNSSSMTTYRIGVEELGETVSELFPPSTDALWADHAESASFASQSLTSSLADYAKLAGNVETRGHLYYFPRWDTNNVPGENGALTKTSILYESKSSNDMGTSTMLWVGSATLGKDKLLDPINRPDFTRKNYWNYRQNFINGIPRHGAGGIFSVHPIVSSVGAFTDQAYWKFVTGSYPIDIDTYPEDAAILERPDWQTYYWSGSSNPQYTPAAGFYAIDRGNGAISSVFNGKWVRIAAMSVFGGDEEIGYKIATGSAYGEHQNPWAGFFGRVRLRFSVSEKGDSQTYQVIDMHLHCGRWNEGITAQVYHSSIIENDYLRKVRISLWYQQSSLEEERTYYDPIMAMDIFIDGLPEDSHDCMIQAQSWGGVKFLDQPNVDPPPLVNTASAAYPSDPRTSAYLIFPTCPGYYSTLGDKQNESQGSALQPYMFQGKKLYIDPNRNMITESAWKFNKELNYKPYSLWVSGSISTQKYYADDDAGQSGVMLAYDPIQSEWRQWTTKGGILVNSASAGESPMELTPKDTVAIGTIMAHAGKTPPPNWLECNGQVLATASYWDLYQEIKTSESGASYGFRCDPDGTPNANGMYFKLPDLRGKFLRGWSHDNPNIDEGRAFASSQAASLGTHYHSVGNFNNGSSDNNAYFIYRMGDDGLIYNGRYLPGHNDDYHFRNLPKGTNYDYSNWAIGTTNPIGFDGKLHPPNVAIIYIIKYSGAINYATPTTTLIGDVEGTVDNNIISKLQGKTISVSTPSDNQVLTYEAGTNEWKPKNLPQASLGRAIPGKSYIVANPMGAFVSADGNELYVYNYNKRYDAGVLNKINMITNVVTSINSSVGSNSSIYGRMFYSGNSSYTPIYFSDVGLCTIESDVDITIYNNSTLWRNSPVSVSFSPDPSNPTVWSLYSGIGASSGVGTFPVVKYNKCYYDGNSWNLSWSDNLDLSMINNNIPFMNFYPGSSYNDELLMFDYNYINKRFYIVDSSTGYLHILQGSQTTLELNWNSLNITYVKTLAIPNIGNQEWSGTGKEKYIIDYDPDTGDERGIIYWRRSPFEYHGVICYSDWPET